MDNTRPADGRQRSVQIGLILPFFEKLMSGTTARWPDILALARAAEALGFDSLWVPDHFLMPWRDGSERTEGAWECCSLLAALAAVTDRIALGSWVNCTNFRNPALLAKIADTIDEISGGRLILGLGAGNTELEHRAFGYSVEYRTSRFEEALAIIHPLLREGRVDFVGRYFNARDCELRPRGPRPQGPPFLMGTRGPRGLKLAVRYADMWDAGFQSLAAAAALRPQVDAACREAGRDPATLVRSVGLRVEVTGSVPYPPGYPAWASPVLTGSTEELAEQFRAFAREGYTNLVLWVNPLTVAGFERIADVLTILDRG